MVENNAPALQVLGSILKSRQTELEAEKSYAPLWQKFSEASAGYVSLSGVQGMASLEHRVLKLEAQALQDIDGASGVTKLTLARELAAVEKVLSDAA